MGKGGSVTPERVVRLLREEVDRIGQNATARAIGIPLFSVQKYLEGNCEPTRQSLFKLSVYFRARVAYLQGARTQPFDRFLEGLRLAGVTPEGFDNRLKELQAKSAEGGKITDYWSTLIETGTNNEFDDSTITRLCQIFGVDVTWVKTGRDPGPNGRSGIVGTVEDNPTEGVIKASWFIPGWKDPQLLRVDAANTAGDANRIPTVSCAKCGGDLRLDDTKVQPGHLSFWPCKVCCRGVK